MAVIVLILALIGAILAAAAAIPGVDARLGFLGAALIGVSVVIIALPNVG